MKANDQQQILIELARLHAVFEQNGDTDRMQKVRLFAEKLMKRNLSIGFAGHFSSGKSTMINALTGDTLLPSSPIPTSANIVNVQKADEDYAIVKLNGRKPVHFPSSYDFETIKAFAKSGDVVSIEIGHADSSLPEGVTVMDTPGVDSTDDAHRLSTESALHIADMVFYVMDYNHVQSELNFSFTKQLQDYTELYLIVNQIDKHQEEELSFESFKQSVYESFKSWGVEPKGIYFTSLKVADFPGNDFPVVKRLVESVMEGTNPTADSTVSTLQKLKEEHLSFLESEKEERLLTFDEVLTPEEWENRETIKAESDSLKRRLAVLDYSDWKLSFERNRKELLNNATITPYEMREALGSYLEAIQPGFKVGILFSAKKTAEERQSRKKELEDQLRHAVKTQISSHMRALMKSSLREARLLTDEEALRIEEMDLTVPFSVVEAAIPSGAVISGTAVLNFSDNLTQGVRKWFVSRTDEWKNEQEKKFNDVTDDNSTEMASKERQLNEKMLAILALEEMEDEIALVKRTLGTAQPNEVKQAEARLASWQKEMEQAAHEMDEFRPDMLKQQETILEEQLDPEAADANSLPDEKAVIMRANRTADLVGDIKGFTETARYLKRKAGRLENQEFTIALFGAFSAGKSSFSNALLGEKVLPVSPNPTTAAINRIKPVTPNQPHETADVHLKTAKLLLEDVQRSFSVLGYTVSSLQDAYAKAPEILKKDAEEQQVHKSFVAAFHKGFPVYGKQLGETVRTDRDEFAKFVAQEDRSCFVDAIDFYYDCPLTQSGITLVDTPGADSINARHTSVAFEYIRNADAILFITYYNHAFARADREFLIQLGRVKEAFEMDKMFFIVNAIDLAADEEEAQAVKTYVRNELQRFGIRFPRLYGVSSLLALTDRTESGMAEFEDAFQKFLQHELKGMAMTAILEEEQKAVGRLKGLIAHTEQNLARKDERLDELKRIEQKARIRFSSSAAAPISREAVGELEELLFYVNQRVFYRFTDFFKEAFNPALFAKKSASEALKTGLQDAVSMTAFDFEQELRATGLRIVNFTEKKLASRFKEDADFLRELNESFSFTPYEPKKPNMLEPGTPFKGKDYSSSLSLFRNTKSFFEKNEKEKIRIALQERMEPDANSFLSSQQKLLEEWLSRWIDEEAEGLRLHMMQQAVDQLESERIMLQQQEKLADWKQRYENLQSERVAVYESAR